MPRPLPPDDRRFFLRRYADANVKHYEQQERWTCKQETAGVIAVLLHAPSSSPAASDPSFPPSSSASASGKTKWNIDPDKTGAERRRAINNARRKEKKEAPKAEGAKQEDKSSGKGKGKSSEPDEEDDKKDGGSKEGKQKEN